MSDITIGRTTQGIALLGLLGAVAALVLAQLPELQRYLKLKSM